MLSDNVQSALNKQINHEFYSAYFYLAISTYFDSTNLPGFAHWMRAQSQEEVGHAMKLFKYVFERDGCVELEAIEKPTVNFSSPLDAFEQVLVHEQKVTSRFNELYALTLQEGDYATQVQIQWFISEQVEEENTARTIIEQLKMIGDHSSALIMLDRHLASR